MNTQLKEKPDLESVEEVKRQADKTEEKVKNTARELLDRLRWGGRAKVEARKHATANHLGTAEAAVRDAAARLRSENQSSVATPLSRVADTVGKVSTFLESNSPEDLADQAASTIRRYPLASLGGAFLAGAAIARVVRASSSVTSKRSH